MSYLNAVGSFVPALYSVSEVAELFALSSREQRIYERYQKIESVALAKDKDLFGILSSAVEKLMASGRVDKRRVSHLIYCHSYFNNTVFSANVVSDLKAHFGLTRAATLSLTMAHCSSNLVAIDVIERLLRASPDDQIIVVAGEKCFTRVCQVINKGGMFGEGAAAALFSNHAVGDHIWGVETVVLGKYALFNKDSSLELPFDSDYPKGIRHLLQKVEKRFQLSLASVDGILCHNVNALSFRQLAFQMGIAETKFFLQNVPRLGHCFCADAFLNWDHASSSAWLKPGGRYVFLTAGLTGTFAAAFFEHSAVARPLLSESSSEKGRQNYV